MKSECSLKGSSKYTSKNQKERDSLMLSYTGIKIKGKYKGNLITLMWEKLKLLWKNTFSCKTSLTVNDIPTIMITHIGKITCAAAQRIIYFSLFLINEIEMFVKIIFSSLSLSFCHWLFLLLILIFFYPCPPILNSS